MIVKMFRHGTGSASGVFNYLLGEDNDREHADVLRGDVDTQKLLIDGLPFKQKYTSGCLSFEESPDQITNQQRVDLMDGFEKTITAGLDDRVSFVWIEHRDKGRLELNFVIANIDLEHGRLFQPYIHSHDKQRVNAWKNIQNIEQGFTDPNDPIKKRLLAQRDNLPRDVKEAREFITNTLEDLVADGLITNRADVIEALQNADFKITRQTDRSISIENPNPDAKRPIRLTGALYERAFKFNSEVQREIVSASEDYRRSDRDRLSANQQVYDEAISRKQDYHRKRHSKPKREHKANTRLRDTSQRLDRQLIFNAPNPYERSNRKTKSTNAADDNRTFEEYEADRERQRDEILRLDDLKVMGSRLVRAIPDSTWLNQRHNVEIIEGAETATRPDAESTTSELRYDSTAITNAGRQRQADSRFEQIIEGIGDNTRAIARSITDTNKVIDNTLGELQHSDSTARQSYSITAAHDRNREAFEVIGSAVKSLGFIVSNKQRLIEDAVKRHRDIKSYQPFLYQSDWSMPSGATPTATANPEPDPRDEYDARQLDIIDSVTNSKSLSLTENEHIVAILTDPEAERIQHINKKELVKHEQTIDTYSSVLTSKTETNPTPSTPKFWQPQRPR